jgi:hypothetical protein
MIVGKLLVLVAGAMTITATTPAYAEPAAIDQVAMEEAMLAYDACLAAATLRAKRIGAPHMLWHDLSKRTCEDVRASLSDGPNAGPVLAAALDAVESIRLGYAQEAQRALASDELAHVSNPRRLDMLSWTQDRQQRIDDAQLGRGLSSRRQPQPQPQPQQRN